MNALTKTWALVGLAAVAATSLPVPAAKAQRICVVHGDTVAQLEKQYGERVTGRGLAEDGQTLVQLLKSDEGTWTVVMTDVHGQSCIIAAGDAWRKLARPGDFAS